MKDIEILEVFEQVNLFYGIITTYAVSDIETVEIQKEITLSKEQLN